MTRNRKITRFSSEWVNLVEHPTRDQYGKPTSHFEVEVPDGVIIIGIKDEQEIVLVRQYRPIVDQITIELPGGAINPNETPEHAARREFLEETGYGIKDIQLIGHFYRSPSRSRSIVYLFGIQVEASRDVANLDGETSEVMLINRAKCMELFGANSKLDVLSAISILYWISL